jgi:septal ring factor EnvC (AmiA/AmiB activator)
MATTVRLAGVAAAALFASLLMPAPASALSVPPAAVARADEHSDCGHHRRGVAALRQEAAELAARRTTVAADLADAESRLAAARTAVAELQALVSALHQRENYLIGELTLTGLIRHSLLIQRGFIELLPDGPEKDRRLAEWEAAQAQNESRAAALGLELVSVRQQLETATAAIDAQQQAEVALTATVAADTQQLAAIDARLAEIAVELSHDRCTPPNG